LWRVQGQVGKREHETQSRKCVSTSPCGIGQWRMPVEAIRAKYQLLHELKMTWDHLEVFAVAGQFSAFGEERNGHEYGISHLILEGHRFLHFTRICKSEIGCLAHQVDVARILRPFR